MNITFFTEEIERIGWDDVTAERIQNPFSARPSHIRLRRSGELLDHPGGDGVLHLILKEIPYGICSADLQSIFYDAKKDLQNLDQYCPSACCN